MRRPGLAAGLAILTLVVAEGRSCGPFFAETVFIAHQPASHLAVIDGPLGLLWPEIHHVDLALFYRRLAGPPFTPTEIAQVQAAEDRLAAASTPQATAYPPPPPGVTEWVDAVNSVAVQAANFQSLDHSVQGNQWQTYPNCLGDAFLTAARTLRDRRAAHPTDQAGLTEWASGQNAVFSNCASNGQMPSVLPSAAPLWLRQDRAYQSAAAHFYRGEWTPATAGFRAIAADRTSPWHEIAPYLVGRTLLRKAALPEAPAPDPNPATTSVTAATAPDPTFNAGTLAQASAQLQAVVAGQTRYAASAQALLDFIQLRAEPGQAAARLAHAISTATEPDLNQALIDLDYTLDNPGNGRQLAEAPANDLVDWIETTQIANAGSAQHALDRWRQTHALPWLATALMLARQPDPALLTAAQAVPQSSPAWLTITYHRLRLTPDSTATRSELTRLLPEITREQSLSSTNAFRELLQRRSTTPAAFLELAATKPVGEDFGDGDGATLFAGQPPDPLMANAHPSYFAGLPVNSADAAFTPYTATILNQQLPLDFLTLLVEQRSLPRHLEFALALATWSRAVLLDRPDIARRLTPAMVAGEPGWTQWLTAYDSATDASERKTAALLALMRFPSVRPYVNTGSVRADGFVGYSEYRDNWWCAEMGQDRSGDPENSFSDGYNFAHSSTTPASGEHPHTLPAALLPGFITPAMQLQAQREQTTLLAVGDAPTYFGRETLAWVRTHPADPRAAEMLGFAYRAMRNGCNLEQSNALRRDVFTTLHKRYPDSEWAHRFPTYDPHDR